MGEKDLDAERDWRKEWQRMKCLAANCTEELRRVTDDGEDLWKRWKKQNSTCRHALVDCRDDFASCFKDPDCRSAAHCAEKLASVCSQDIFNVMNDNVTRESLHCVLDCNEEMSCVLFKCGRKAAPCLLDSEAPCHKALFCMKDAREDCTLDNF